MSNCERLDPSEYGGARGVEPLTPAGLPRTLSVGERAAAVRRAGLADDGTDEGEYGIRVG